MSGFESPKLFSKLHSSIICVAVFAGILLRCIKKAFGPKVQRMRLQGQQHHKNKLNQFPHVGGSTLYISCFFLFLRNWNAYPSDALSQPGGGFSINTCWCICNTATFKSRGQCQVLLANICILTQWNLHRRYESFHEIGRCTKPT